MPPVVDQDCKSQPQASIFPGLFLLLLGIAGLAWFPYQIMNHRSSYGLLGYREYTIQDYLRSIGPMALLSLHFVIMGIGRICRQRWANRPAMLIGCVIVFALWFTLNR